MTNVLLKVVLRNLIHIEAPSDTTTLITSLTIKLFLASFVNTAFLTLLINGNIWPFMGANAELEGDASVLENLNSFGLMNGQFTDFGEKWYEEIGVPICITMIINMISPHIFVLLEFVMKGYSQCVDRSYSSDHTLTKQVTQHDLENMYTGPEFNLYLRYAQLLNTLFVCLMFSSGMPVLIPICCFTFMGYYFADKYMLFRFYSLPPMLDSALAQAVSSILPYAVMLHLMFGMWMMSNDEFFSAAGVMLTTDFGNSTKVPLDLSVNLDASSYFGDNLFMQTVYERFTHKNCYIMFAVFLLLLVSLLWNRLIVKILQASEGFIALFPCFRNCLSKNHEAEGNDPYLHSISRERLDLQLRQNLLFVEVLAQYKAEIERRDTTVGFKAPEKEINILESYNFEANQGYVEEFASDASSVIEYNNRKRTMTTKTRTVTEGAKEGAKEGVEKVEKVEKKAKVEDLSTVEERAAEEAGAGGDIVMSKLGHQESAL